MNPGDKVEAIFRCCREKRIPFVVDTNVLIAKAVGADGVHVSRDGASPRLTRRIMGPQALIGVSARGSWG